MIARYDPPAPLPAKRGLQLEFSVEDGELAARTLHEMARSRPRISIDRQAVVELSACLGGPVPQLVVIPVLDNEDGEPLYGQARCHSLDEVDEIFVY